MKIPSNLTLRCTVDGKPVDGIFCYLRLKALRKNDFVALVGPTNKNGVVQVTWSEAMEQIRDDIRLAQLDYGSPVTDFSGEIIIEPLTEEQLKGALDAYKIYEGLGRYPRDWESHLSKGIKKSQLLPSSASIDVSVNHDGEDLTINLVRKVM